MGRYYLNRKTTAEECKSIDVFFLKKHNYFINSYKSGTLRWLRGEEETGSIGISVDAENEYLQMQYTSTDWQTEEKKSKDYKIRLTTTPCHFGDKRYWFLCSFCNRRVGKLFLYGKNDFACRHCLNLSYDIRNASGIEKALRKITPAPDLDEMRASMRTRLYRGKPTKRLLKYLKKVGRFKEAMFLVKESL